MPDGMKLEILIRSLKCSTNLQFLVITLPSSLTKPYFKIHNKTSLEEYANLIRYVNFTIQAMTSNI